MSTNPTARSMLVFVLVLAVALLAYGALTMPDHRNTPEKIGDAVHELPQGLGKASRQLEDRTPGQKLGDDIKDSTAPR